MIKKVELAQRHHEVFGNPAPLGLLGLAIACAALTPIAFGYGITPEGKLISPAFVTAGAFALLFGAGCQLLAGLMDFANRNAFGGTIFTAFSFNWMITGFTLIGLAFGYVLDHTILLATEVLLLIVFSVLTYGFGFFSRLLFPFLVDEDLLYVCRIIRTLSGTTVLNIPIAFFTVFLGLIGLWLALGGLINPVTGGETFWIGGPIFHGRRRKGFDWSLRQRVFHVLYQYWKENAFAEMPLETIKAQVRAAGPGPVRAGFQKESIVPDLFYLMEYGSLKRTLSDAAPEGLVSARLTSAGIDLYEQLILRKYDF